MQEKIVVSKIPKVANCEHATTDHADRRQRIGSDLRSRPIRRLRSIATCSRSVVPLLIALREHTERRPVVSGPLIYNERATPSNKLRADLRTRNHAAAHCWTITGNVTPVDLTAPPGEWDGDAQVKWRHNQVWPHDRFTCCLYLSWLRSQCLIMLMSSSYYSSRLAYPTVMWVTLYMHMCLPDIC